MLTTQSQATLCVRQGLREPLILYPHSRPKLQVAIHICWLKLTGNCFVLSLDATGEITEFLKN